MKALVGLLTIASLAFLMPLPVEAAECSDCCCSETSKMAHTSDCRCPQSAPCAQAPVFAALTQVSTRVFPADSSTATAGELPCPPRRTERPPSPPPKFLL